MPARAVSPRYLPYVLDVAANTFHGAPLETPIELPVLHLQRVELTVPSGHLGFTGFGIDVSGERILPFGSSSDWIVADDARLSFDFDLEVSGKMVLSAFNQDVAYRHKFYVRLLVAEFPLPASSGPATAMVF